MGTNKWGYTVTDTSTNASSYSGLTYKSVPTSATQIASGNATSSYTVDVSKRLVFAARFAEEAAPGNYSAKITMSAVATAKQASWSELVYMQDMNPLACAEASTGATKALKDSRDTNSYTVVKLKDGHCWMQENLKLGGSSTITLTSSDSNVTSNYTLPASSDNSWSSSDAAQQIRVGKTGMTVDSSATGDGKGWQSSYGNYYSWCAATAGTCSESTSDNVNVSGSICPKNWHLPSGGSSSVTGTNVGQNSEFYKLLNGLNMSAVTVSPYLFSAAGDISSDGLRFPGTNIRYWSSTSHSSRYAYRLFSTSGVFYPGTDYNGRYYGFSVRCVADY